MKQLDTNPQRPQNQVHKKMTKDANYEGSSQQLKEDLINKALEVLPTSLLKYLEKWCK